MTDQMPEFTPSASSDRRLQTVQPTRAPASAEMFTDARVELIRETVAKGAPDDVFKAMIDIARTRGLDPMAKQIGVAKFDKNGGYQIYMPIDGYRAVAGDHPDFAGKDKPEYGPVVGKTPAGKPYPEWCSVTVYRLVQGQRMPFTAEVWWDEFYGANYSWNKMPRVMLAKVAEAHALRMAFTRSLSGTYTPEEMDQASVEVQGRMVQPATGEVTATVEPVDHSEEPDWQTASKRLHAVAQEVISKDAEVAHQALHLMAVQTKGVDSLKQVDTETLTKMTTFIQSDEFASYFDKYVKAKLEVSDGE